MKATPLSHIPKHLLLARSSSCRRGQAMIEYAVVAGMLVASLAILVVFLFAFKEYGGRILDFAGSEYP